MNRIYVALLVGAALAVSVTSASALDGALWPAPGGNTFAWSGGGSAGDVGGTDGNYGNFDNSAYIDLFWGPQWDLSGPQAGLDGVFHDLSFLSVSGTTAIWEGVTSYTSPGGPGPASCGSCPIRLVIDIGGLTGTPWLLEASVPGLTGLAPGVGAVVDITAGLDFVANLRVLADLGSGFTAINPVPQSASGGPWAVSSISGGFYSNIPEPSTALLVSLGLIGMGSRARRRSR